MNKIIERNNVNFGFNSLKKINEFVELNNFSRAIVLVDENTKKHCLDHLKGISSFEFETIEIHSGETHKHIYTCLNIWEELSEKGADRNSVLINLGGGVITDTGGFVASCYRRGIRFVHIPTSLLAMVDAALGGKNGVDLNNLKNQIGVIRLPEMIICDYHFLETLPINELKSGFAEILKHGLIDSNYDYLKRCLAISDFNSEHLSSLIQESILIKLNIVEKDIDETGLRKTLNYGHTLGHAIESYRMSLSQEKHLLHGEAIAIGLVLESYISFKMFNFPESELFNLREFVIKNYDKEPFEKKEILKIIELMKYDKKNNADKVNFVLLKGVGEPRLDCQVEENLIFEAFEFYSS